jgi:hypothetical protein
LTFPEIEVMGSNLEKPSASNIQDIGKKCILFNDSEYEEGEEATEDLQKAPWETEEESSSEWPSEEEEPAADSDAEES